MKGDCALICENCKKENIYFINKENSCSECGRAIKLDKGIERLVVTLNRKGFVTEKSCEGHNGFDNDKKDYPWISFADESEESISLIEEMIGETESWYVGIERTTFGVRRILRTHKEGSLEEAQKEIDKLIDLIEG